MLHLSWMASLALELLPNGRKEMAPCASIFERLRNRLSRKKQFLEAPPSPTSFDAESDNFAEIEKKSPTPSLRAAHSIDQIEGNNLNEELELRSKLEEIDVQIAQKRELLRIIRETREREERRTREAVSILDTPCDAARRLSDGDFLPSPVSLPPTATPSIRNVDLSGAVDSPSGVMLPMSSMVTLRTRLMGGGSFTSPSLGIIDEALGPTPAYLALGIDSWGAVSDELSSIADAIGALSKKADQMFRDGQRWERRSDKGERDEEDEE